MTTQAILEIRHHIESAQEAFYLKEETATHIGRLVIIAQEHEDIKEFNELIEEVHLRYLEAAGYLPELPCEMEIALEKIDAKVSAIEEAHLPKPPRVTPAEYDPACLLTATELQNRLIAIGLFVTEEVRDSIGSELTSELEGRLSDTAEEFWDGVLSAYVTLFGTSEV